MSLATIAGISIQVAALGVVHRVIGGRWLRRPGALFLLLAVLYHSATEIMQAVWPGRNPYRRVTTQDGLDNWILLVTAAIVVYAAFYVISTRRQARVNRDSAAREPAAHISGLYLWWLLPACAVLMALTAAGKGLRQPTAVTEGPDTSSYLSTGLAGQYLIVLMAATGAVILIQYGTRWTWHVLVAEAGLLALTGARSSIVLAVILTVFATATAGLRLPRRKVIAAVALISLLAVVISASRSVVGRTQFAADQGVAARLDALGTGVAALDTAGVSDVALNDFVYRFDGNSYGSMVLAQLQAGTDPVGLATVRDLLLLAVPRFLQPDKLDASSLESRSEESYFIRQFGLGVRDYLPGQFGSFVGYYGPLGLLLIAALLGALFAVVERWLARRATGVRLVLAVGLVECVLMYESGPTRYVITARGLIPLAAAVWFVTWWMRRRRSVVEHGDVAQVLERTA